MMINFKKIFYSKSAFKLYGTAASNIMENPIVTVTGGKVKGAVKKLYDGSSYYSFKGIPFAQPPVGKLRFKAPVPPKPWIDVFDATEHGPICPQVALTKLKSDIEDENCLLINVYSKSLQSDSRLPVLVYIYGGGFLSGSGNSETYGPEFLLPHDVVVVTFNYRVEAFGFLCLDTPEVPGNAGMKDQVAALRWVQDNIRQFGGDPSNVTIFGESAGGASVTYHLLSPMTDGLFHKAIAQSGACLADWPQGKNGKDRAFRLGKFLGKETKDPKELLDFLQVVPVEALTARVTMKTSTEDELCRGLPLRFVPVVEKKFNGVESFINEEPLDMILSNKIKKVPTILGYNTLEGLFFVTHQAKIMKFMNENPQYVVPLELAEKVSLQEMRDLGERIKKFYVGDEDYTENNILKIADREMDTHIAYSAHRFAHFYSKFNKLIYIYLFDCDTDLNYAKKSNRHSKGTKGAGHADDLPYLFNHIVTAGAYEQQDRLKHLVYRMTKLWTDFAKTGNPTPNDSLGITWNPYTTAGKEYLYIGEEMSMKRYAHRERIEFWDTLYAELGRPCISRTSNVAKAKY